MGRILIGVTSRALVVRELVAVCFEPWGKGLRSLALKRGSMEQTLSIGVDVSNTWPVGSTRVGTIWTNIPLGTLDAMSRMIPCYFNAIRELVGICTTTGPDVLYLTATHSNRMHRQLG